MTPAQERGWQAGFPRFGLTLQAGQLDWDQTFGFAGRRIVEIGFGMGDSLLQMAQADPAAQFIGIEVHRPGVGRLLSQLLASETSNLRVFAEDAVEVMEQCFAPNTVDGIHIFFPDPWHKKRHHKRQIDAQRAPTYPQQAHVVSASPIEESDASSRIGANATRRTRRSSYFLGVSTPVASIS